MGKLVRSSVGQKICDVLGIDSHRVTEIIFRQTSALPGTITITLLPDSATGEPISKIFRDAEWAEVTDG